MNSVSGYGNGYITLETDKSADLDQLRFEVATLVRQLYPQLPKEVSYHIINLNSPDQETQQKPLMSLQFNGRASMSELKVYADEQLKPKLSQIEGIYTVNVYGGNKQEWVLTYDRNQRQNARSQPDIYQLMNGEYEQIKVVPADSKGFDTWSLMNQSVKVDKNMVKLFDFAKTQRQKISPEIHKENQEYLRMVSFEYFGSQNFGQKFFDKTLQEIKPQMPLGYTAKKKGYDWSSTEAKQQYWLIGLVIILIYIICAIIFESLLQPLALILQIPISFVGVFLTFYWFDFNFDQGGYASFVLLSGNVVCAAIFIIAEFNNLRKLHPTAKRFRLYIKAYHHKIIPILLTVLSTVVGLVPFLIYGQNEVFWFALGAGTIGGLMMSLIGIVLYLPLFLRFGQLSNQRPQIPL